MSDIKISETVKKTAKESFDGMPIEDQIRRDYEPFVQRQFQLAINEACKPLVSELEELCNRVDAWDKAVEDIIGRRSNANMSTVEARAALAAHRKEHGP